MYRLYSPSVPKDYSPSLARAHMERGLESAAELRRDTDMLPRVAADGSSECPFAEDLFFRKEKTAQYVRDDLEVLRQHLRFCTKHIGVQQDQGHELAHRREALNGEAAQDHFARAELRLEDDMRMHRQLRRDLIDAIAEVEATLREAGARQFPGRDPRGPFGARLYSPPRVPKPLEELTKNNAREEIQRLLGKSKDW